MKVDIRVMENDIVKMKNKFKKGSKEDPAYLVKSEAGNIALKLGRELPKS